MRTTTTICAALTAILLTGSEQGQSRGQAPRISERPLIIRGYIGGGNLEPLSHEVLVRISAGEKELHLIIDSPGGETPTGFTFISTMEAAKQAGIHLVCWVPRQASSMAFQILTHCSERHILRYTTLLWHSARVYARGPLTSDDLSYLAYRLGSLDSIILGELREVLQIPEELLMYHFQNSTAHLGIELAAMAPAYATVHDYVPGLLEMSISTELPSNPKVDNMSSYRTGSPVYCNPEYLLQLGGTK